MLGSARITVSALSLPYRALYAGKHLAQLPRQHNRQAFFVGSDLWRVRLAVREYLMTFLKNNQHVLFDNLIIKIMIVFRCYVPDRQRNLCLAVVEMQKLAGREPMRANIVGLPESNV